MSLLDSLATSHSSPLDAYTMMGTLALAAALGAFLAFVYRRTAGDSYNPDIAQSQIVLAVLMALVMTIVGDHLGRGFGSVGVLSVMRFRVKMRSASEALTLLGAVVVGMAAGVGMLRDAVIGTCFLSLLSLAMAFIFAPGPKPTGSVIEEDA